MPYVHDIAVATEPVKLLRFPHDWNNPLHVDIFAYSNIEYAETGEENRSPDDASIRFYVHLNVLAKGEAAQQMRQFLATYQGERVAVPLYGEAFSAAAFSAAARLAPSYVLNYDPEDLTGQTVHEVASGPLVPAYPTTAPLHFGRLAKVEEAQVTDDPETDQAAFHLVIDDDAPDSLRMLALDDALPASWPTGLNYPSNIAESYDLPLAALQYGPRPQKALDRQENVFRYGQGFTLTLTDSQIAQLYSFWASRHGPVNAFAAPSYFTPGDASPEAPHGTIVRFAEERIRISYTSRDTASVDVSFVQLPWEIDTEETYEFPRRVFLYKFVYQTPTPVVDAFSGSSQLVTMGGLDYLPGFVEPSDIALDLRNLANEKLTIRSHAEAGNPLLRFYPGPLEAPLTVEVWECDPADPDNTAELLYPGTVETIRPERRSLNAEVSLFGGLLRKQVCNVIAGPDCQTHIYSPACGLDPDDFEETGTIADISANVVTIDTAAADAANAFVDGWIEIGDEETFQVREIVASAPGSGTQVLTLDEPLNSTAAVTDPVKFFPGCNGSYVRCNALGNGINFKGIPRGPRQNISLKTFSHPEASQTKK